MFFNKVQKIGHKKNTIFVLMVVSMILSYLPWYNFSAVLKYIVQEYSLTVEDTSLILSIFQAGYVIIVILSGWIADKIGPRKVITIATLFTAIFSTAFIFVVYDFKSILIMRLLTGLSAGAIYVPGMSLLSGWFPANERGKVLGAYTGALTLAYAGGYFIAAPLASSFGWRMGILATSIPSFVAVYLLIFLISENPDEIIEDDLNKDLKEKTGSDISNDDKRGQILLTTGYMGHMWELYAFWGWIGPFMVSCALAQGYSPAEAVSTGGILAAIIILLGAPSSFIAGMLADKFGRIKTILICSFFSLIAQFAFGFLYGKTLSTIFIFGLWIGFWIVADSAIYKAGLTELVSKNSRAKYLSIQSALGYTMTIISPYVFGKALVIFNSTITDTSQASSWGIPFMILGIGALFSPLSTIILSKLPQAKLLTGGYKK